jgi:hypothetical protein
MSVEPHALIKANHACREKFPTGARLYFSVDNVTMVEIKKSELKTNGRVQLVYQQDQRHRRQVTVDGDVFLVVSFQDLSNQSFSTVMRQAGRVSGLFRGCRPLTNESRAKAGATSVLTNLITSNFYG